MQKDANVFAHDLRESLLQAADPQRAEAMAAYMKGKFPFFGIPTPERRARLKPLTAWVGRSPDPEWLLDMAETLWRFDERECQYVAADLLVKHASRIDAAHEGRIARLIRTKSWWDTVDPLAARVYGDLLGRSPALLPVMHAYAEHEDLWLRRVAILHQLHYGAATDVQRLDEVLCANLEHPDFFVRKAMGWALRQYARTNPEWVRTWLGRHHRQISPLTHREASKHL